MFQKIKNKKQVLIFSVITLFTFSFLFLIFYSDNGRESFFRKIVKQTKENFAAVIYVNRFSTTTNTTNITPTITEIVFPPESPIDYKDNGDGTITDNYTRLMWAKCTQGNGGDNCAGGSPSFREWSKAKSECEGLNLAGKTGWRLPTLKELQSIINTSFFNPSINKTFFPNTSSEPYWTSTAPAKYSSSKFTVLFSDGTVYFKSEGNFAAIRCVRNQEVK